MARTEPFTLNAHTPAGLLHLRDDPVDIRRHAAERLALRRDIDVDGAPQLVVIDLGRADDAVDIGDHVEAR